MKKLFLSVCFISLFAAALPGHAAVTAMRDEIALQQHNIDKSMNLRPMAEPAGVPANFEDFVDFIRERSKTVEKTSMDVLQKSSSMNVIDDISYIASQRQEKSTFEKIYESAMERLKLLEKKPSAERINTPALVAQEIKQEQQNLQNAAQNPKTQKSLDVVNVTLPGGQTVLAPAKEHIPYLSAKIDIMPNGMVHIIETVSLVANGQKLKYGLNKALPKYSVSREGVRNNTIPYLNGVRVNGQSVPYRLQDAGDRYLITPEKQFELPPGIYTYEFDYMLDRKLWYYDDRNEFYWDVTGSFWNLAISQAIATIRLPVDIRPLGQNMLIGYLPNLLTDRYTTITQHRHTNALGFTATRPLFAGEGLHILVSIPKAGFMEPDFNKKFEWFIEDYGDIIFSLAGFLAIIIAYIVSWRYISQNASGVQADMQKTPPLLRLLAQGKFDKVSFASFLLDLFRRGIIDLKSDHESFVIIKKTDNLSRLNKYEKKAYRQLIGAKEFSVTFSRGNALKLKRAAKLIEKDTFKRLKLLSLKLNAGYILFSCAMLLLSEGAVALLSVNPAGTFGMLLSATVTAAFYIWLLRKHFERRRLQYVIKFFAAVMIVLSAMVMSLYIHTVSILFILGMIWSIFIYTSLFAKRNGLIKNNIRDAVQFARYLRDNAKAIILGGEFRLQQANIYALDAADNYPKSKETARDYRLDLMPAVIRLL